MHGMLQSCSAHSLPGHPYFRFGLKTLAAPVGWNRQTLRWLTLCRVGRRSIRTSARRSHARADRAAAPCLAFGPRGRHCLAARTKRMRHGCSVEPVYLESAWNTPRQRLRSTDRPPLCSAPQCTTHSSAAPVRQRRSARCAAPIGPIDGNQCSHPRNVRRSVVDGSST